MAAAKCLDAVCKAPPGRKLGGDPQSPMHERAAQVRAGGGIDDEVVGGIVALLPESAQHPAQQAGQFAPLRLVGVDERGPVFFRYDPDFARMLGGERGDREEMGRRN